MLTKQELDQLDKLFQKTYKALIRDIRKDLQGIKNDSSENTKSFKEIKVGFDEIKFLIEKFSKKQRILEKKMRAIEEYFDQRD